MNFYFTLSREAECEYTVNKSRFIGSCAGVCSSDEAVSFINEIKRRYPDANHHVYAYCIRQPEYSRYSDDGEPQGTAGVPVLEAVKKNSLTDACVVVTRYFGGVLLGAGGLVRAYSHTAASALKASGTVKIGLCSVLRIVCDYSFYKTAASLIEKFSGKTENTDFSADVKINFLISGEKEYLFREQLTEMTLGRVKAEKIGERFDSI